jgi:hypothetical protein
METMQKFHRSVALLSNSSLRKWCQEEVRAMPKKSAAESTAPKSRKSPAAKSAPTHDEIALRAYHNFLRRNGAPGSPFDDWKQAEQQLLAESAAKPKSRRKSKVVSIAA